MKCCENLRITKNATETAQEICSIYAQSDILTIKSKTGFQSFILVIHHWEMNQDMVTHQTSIKILLERRWNVICVKVLKN